MIIRAGLTPAKELMEVATVAQLTDWFMFKKEQTFLICDEATRKTGRLIKVGTFLLPPPCNPHQPPPPPPNRLLYLMMPLVFQECGS